SLNALGLAGALWLLIAPHAIFEVGFQYSFCAVLFILLFYGRLERALQRLWRSKSAQPVRYFLLYKFLIPLLSVSLCAQAGISLVQLYHFGHLSLLSPIANLLAVPLAYPTLAVGFWFWLSQGVGVLPVELLSAWQKWVALTFGADWVPALRGVGIPAIVSIAFYAGVLLFAPEPPLGEVDES
ncbi:MAG: ComEC/Rec2 family competence protein, partial [Fimbriimonadales bacterium]|nr:ComEC/Rec2 family competence protein [Fimbriimonadales bacterium]